MSATIPTPHASAVAQLPPLAEMPIARRWQPRHPDRLQLYSLPTPNGVKVSIALEEIGLPYEAHTVSLDRRDQLTPEFMWLNPNNKLPAIIDPNGPGGQPLALFESGAILMYLAEKTGKLLPADAQGRYHALQWLMFQVGGVGPMMGQLGYFHTYAGREIEDKRPLQRYVDETRRLLGVLDAHLSGREWMLDSGYGVADIAIFPWVRNLITRYNAADMVGFADFAQVRRVLDAFLARPAVQRGLAVPAV